MAIKIKRIYDPKAADDGNVTLVYGAKEERFNNAAALQEYIEKRSG